VYIQLATLTAESTVYLSLTISIVYVQRRHGTDDGDQCLYCVATNERNISFVVVLRKAAFVNNSDKMNNDNQSMVHGTDYHFYGLPCFEKWVRIQLKYFCNIHIKLHSNRKKNCNCTVVIKKSPDVTEKRCNKCGNIMFSWKKTKNRNKSWFLYRHISNTYIYIQYIYQKITNYFWCGARHLIHQAYAAIKKHQLFLWYLGRILNFTNIFHCFSISYYPYINCRMFYLTLYIHAYSLQKLPTNYKLQ